MKVPYEIRPEASGASLNEIALRHRQAVSYYQELSENPKIDNEGAQEWFRMLRAYRQELLDGINAKLTDMSAGVHTPSSQGNSWFKDNSESFTRAFNAGNLSEINEMIYQAEKSLSDTYRQLLDNHKLRDFAEELLHQQHEIVLEKLLEADRYRKVGQQNKETNNR